MESVKFALIVVALITAVTALSACSSGGGSDTTTGPGELADEALVVYTDPGGAFSFQHPKSWTQAADPDASVRFAGRDAFVSVTVAPSAGADAMAYALQDKTAVASNFAGYREISLTASSEVKGAAVLTFEWDAGKSAVTGKDVRGHVDRYYIPQAGGRVAIMTGSEPVDQFDRETIRDVALSVKVNA